MPSSGTEPGAGLPTGFAVPVLETGKGCGKAGAGAGAQDRSSSDTSSSKPAGVK